MRKPGHPNVDGKEPDGRRVKVNEARPMEQRGPRSAKRRQWRKLEPDNPTETTTPHQLCGVCVSASQGPHSGELHEAIDSIPHSRQMSANNNFSEFERSNKLFHLYGNHHHLRK